MFLWNEYLYKNGFFDQKRDLNVGAQSKICKQPSKKVVAYTSILSVLLSHSLDFLLSHSNFLLSNCVEWDRVRGKMEFKSSRRQKDSDEGSKREPSIAIPASSGMKNPIMKL